MNLGYVPGRKYKCGNTFYRETINAKEIGLKHSLGILKFRFFFLTSIKRNQKSPDSATWTASSSIIMK